MTSEKSNVDTSNVDTSNVLQKQDLTSNKENLISKDNVVQENSTTSFVTAQSDELSQPQESLVLEERLEQDEFTKSDDTPTRPDRLSKQEKKILKDDFSETSKTPSIPQRRKKGNNTLQDIDSLTDDTNSLEEDSDSHLSTGYQKKSLSGWKNIERSIENAPLQEISRIEIPFNKVNADHIQKIFASTRIKLTENLICSKIEEINNRKRDALSFFRNYIRIRMLKEAKKLHIRIDPRDRKYVRTFGDISLAVKNNNSMSFYKKLWEVTTGQFDKSLYWAEAIAAKYMREEQIQYIKNEKIHGVRTNCMEQLAKWARADLVRRFQLLGKKHHGRYLLVSVYKGTKKRRKPGIFQENFIMTTEKSNPIVSLQICSLTALNSCY